MEKNIKVCVTGGASFLGSSLVKKLLERGYYVNATLRNLGDPLKVGLLKGLPNADTRLELFEADIYNPDEFGRTIQGCQTVVHMATPLQHNPLNSQHHTNQQLQILGLGQQDKISLAALDKIHSRKTSQEPLVPPQSRTSVSSSSDSFVIQKSRR